MKQHRLNIGIYIPRLVFGGAELLSVQIANQMLRMGHDVQVIVNAESPELTKFNIQAPLHLLNERSLFGASRALAATTSRLNVCYLISFLELGNFVADLSVLLHGQSAAVINTWHGFWGSITGSKSKAAYLGLGLLSRIASMNVAVSHSLARQLVEFGCPIRKLTVIHNGIVLPTGVHGHTHERPYVLTAGSLRKHKGQETLIRAFAQFRAAFDWDLLIAGKGPMEPALVQLVAELGLQSRVKFLGFQHDLFPYFAGARMFVLPSTVETFALVIVEAMACGTPVIATDCGGPRELLDNGAYGRLVPPGDMNAMAGAMVDFARQRHYPEQLINRAREFSIIQVVHKYIELCEKLSRVSSLS